MDIPARSAERPINKREVLICTLLGGTTVQQDDYKKSQSIQHSVGVCRHESTCKLSITFLAWLLVEKK